MAEIRVKETGTIKLFESDNTSSVTIASPASLGADRTVTLPDANVTLASGTMLATDGSGASLTGLPDNTPAFEAYLNAPQTSISDDTWTEVVYDAEQFDSDSKYNTSTGRFTPGTAGKYFCYSNLALAITGGGNQYGNRFYKNGVANTYAYIVQDDEAGYGEHSLYCAAIIDLNATDYLSTYGLMKGGSARSFNGVSGISYSFFGAFLLIGA